MSYESVDGEEAVHDVRRRRLVRREGELPFVPFGLVPAAGLGLLFLLALWPFALGVQGATRQAVDKALAANGMDWAKPSASGQWVVIRGEPPTAAEANRAKEIAREAKASTPFGMARPARRVRVPQGPFKARPNGDAVPLPPIQDVTEEAAKAPAWRFTVAGGTLSLQGEVPDEATREALIAHANASLDPPRIDRLEEGLTVAGTDAPQGYLDVARRGIDTVTKCDTGNAVFEEGRFSLRCELPDTGAADVRAAANASMPFGTVGKVDILPHEAVVTCENSLSDLLKDARIEFDSSSSVIDPSSNALLDEVAAAVRACPGTLRIEGHTDSTGTEDENSTLSRNRALAVRNALVARNVDPKRLIAEGYGATRPVAVNTTPEGRARNRRIEIRVVRASE